jgi:hypothetical protein
VWVCVGVGVGVCVGVCMSMRDVILKITECHYYQL